MTYGYRQLLDQASLARCNHRLADAMRYASDAVDVCRGDGGRLGLAEALTALGTIERQMCHLEDAARNYQEVAAIFREEGDSLRSAHSIRQAGDILRAAKSYDLARNCYDEALNVYRNHPKPDRLDLANAIRGMAILKGDRGEVEGARALWEEAKDLYEAVGVDEGVAECIERLAGLPMSQS